MSFINVSFIHQQFLAYFACLIWKDPPDCIKSLRRVDELTSGWSACNSLLENVNSKIFPAFSSSARHGFSVLRWYFVRWEVSGLTAAALYGAICSIYSEQNTKTLCSSQLAFPRSVSLKIKWCNSTVVLLRIQFEEFPFYLIGRSDFHMVDNLSAAVHD